MSKYYKIQKFKNPSYSHYQQLKVLTFSNTFYFWIPLISIFSMTFTPSTYMGSLLCFVCFLPRLLFFFFFSFLCIYFLWHLFPGHKFLFLQFLLGNLLFWFRNNLFFFSKDQFTVAGRAHVWVESTMSSVSPAPHLGGFVHLDVLSDQRIYI